MDIGLYGLAIMGQNFALNMASKGFKVSVCNRSPQKVDATVERAASEGVSYVYIYTYTYIYIEWILMLISK